MRRHVLPTAPSPTTTHLQRESVSQHSCVCLSSHGNAKFPILTLRQRVLWAHLTLYSPPLTESIPPSRKPTRVPPSTSHARKIASRTYLIVATTILAKQWVSSWSGSQINPQRKQFQYLRLGSYLRKLLSQSLRSSSVVQVARPVSIPQVAFVLCWLVCDRGQGVSRPRLLITLALLEAFPKAGSCVPPKSRSSTIGSPSLVE